MITPRRVAIVPVLVVLLGRGVFAPPPALEPRYEAALADLAERDRAAHEALVTALTDHPEQAMKHLEGHASYLEELDRARHEDPSRYGRLLAQEEMERAVRELVTTLADEEEPAARAALVLRVRDRLATWFELRQELRETEGERLADEIAHQREALALRDPGERRQHWLVTVTEGGPAAMQQRIEMLASQQPLEAFAPAIVQTVMRHDPARGRALARLADRDPQQFRIVLEEVVVKHPEVLERAQATAGEAVHLQLELRSAARAAHTELLPLVIAVGASLTLDDLDGTARGRIEQLVDLERAVTGAHLDSAANRLEQLRALLEHRAAHRDMIIELQLARMLGEEERWAW